jgi:hypothetical protein
LSSSLWIRGAPHSEFSWLIRRINARSPAATDGQLGAHAEIDVGLVNQIGRVTQRKYLGFVRGTGTSKYR